MSVRVLIVGAYGLIGSAITRALDDAGFVVGGLGRNQWVAKRAFPQLNWVYRDLRNLTNAQDWQEIVHGYDFVVNASGILQDQGHDDTTTIHIKAVGALAVACKVENIGLIQISSVGAVIDASTDFLRTKAMGDAEIEALGLNQYWILQPGLVIGRSAYGGSALLRMIASIPIVTPLAYAETPIQTVGLDDLARVVVACCHGEIPPNSRYDLVEPQAQRMDEILRKFRNWLGWQPTRYQLAVPLPIIRIINLASDALGYLGWRSPLRTTASKVLADGVTGDPTAIKTAIGHDLNDLTTTFARHPARTEDRQSALLYMLKPIVLFTLFFFWLLSGIFGLVSIDQAATTLTNQGWAGAMAKTSVIAWSCVDIALAIGLAFRRSAGMACIGMAIVSLIYLFAATLFTPMLWIDPLGPLVKIFPAMVLALVGRASMEVR